MTFQQGVVREIIPQIHDTRGDQIYLYSVTIGMDYFRLCAEACRSH